MAAALRAVTGERLLRGAERPESVAAAAAAAACSSRICRRALTGERLLLGAERPMAGESLATSRKRLDVGLLETMVTGGGGGGGV